jgi:translation elongation factor EF-G
MKTCSTCGKEKEITEYYKCYAKCKACCYEVTQKYRASERGKEVRRKETINARLSGKKNERQKKYETTEKGKLAAKNYYQGRYKTPKGKLRESAKNAVRHALKTGRLVKEPCFACGSEESVAHHSSYARDMRLVVTWLCTPHHNEIHNPVEV